MPYKSLFGSLTINKNSEQPEKTWDVTKYLRNEESDKFYARSNLGGLATTQTVLNSPEADAMPDWDVYRHELRHAKTWPSHPKMIAIAKNVIAPYGQKAVIGEMSVSDAMKAAGKEAREMLEY